MRHLRAQKYENKVIKVERSMTGSGHVSAVCCSVRWKSARALKDGERQTWVSCGQLNNFKPSQQPSLPHALTCFQPGAAVSKFFFLRLVLFLCLLLHDEKLIKWGWGERRPHLWDTNTSVPPVLPRGFIFFILPFFEMKCENVFPNSPEEIFVPFILPHSEETQHFLCRCGTAAATMPRNLSQATALRHTISCVRVRVRVWVW